MASSSHRESSPGDSSGLSSPGGVDRDQDVLVSRLVARIAELEERLFKADLDAPLVRNGIDMASAPPRMAEGDVPHRSFLSLRPVSARPPVGGKSLGLAASPAPLPPGSPSGNPQPSVLPLRRSVNGGYANAAPPVRSSPTAAIASISNGSGTISNTGAAVMGPSPRVCGDDPDFHNASGDLPSTPAAPTLPHMATSPVLPAASSAVTSAATVAGSAAVAAATTAADLKSTATEWLSKMRFSWGVKDGSSTRISVGAPPGTSPAMHCFADGTAASSLQQPAAPTPGRTSSFTRGPNGEAIVQVMAFNEKAFEMQLEAPGVAARLRQPVLRGPGSQSTYFRYVFDPADVEAEMEVTARVRRAAAEALMEANEKLKAAEEQQEALTRQLEQARELDKVVVALKAEHEATLARKRELEEDAIAASAQLERTRAAADAATSEVEGLREATEIWKSGRSSEQEKLKQENALIRSQLTTRLHELQAAKNKIGDLEAEKQRLLRDLDELNAKLKWLQTVNHKLEAATEQLESHRKASAEWHDQFLRERNVRRKLHEQLQQLKGNIRVMCRVRPVQAGQKSIVSSPLEGLLAVMPEERRQQEFEFDHVLCGETSQAEVFAEVLPLVRSCADGFNVCIFAYGQTGSGKTYTMEGPVSDPGINVRAISELFRIAAEEGRLAPVPTSPVPSAGGAVPGANGSGAAVAGPALLTYVSATPGAPPAASSSTICVSMLEIYNEAVLDLLRPNGSDLAAGPRQLEVVGLGPGELAPGQDRVVDLTWRPVSNTNEVKQVLREGWRNRATATTALNVHSSRSHALLTVKVSFVHVDGREHTSTIHLVDLAGSERVDKSEVTGQQLKEAQSINKSLSALGDVISALQRRSSHIPFRNSKLTQVLQDSLCGSSKVLLVCNISPEAASASETLSSLNFASRAAQVELGQAKKVMERNASADRLAGPSPDRLAHGTATSSSTHSSPGGNGSGSDGGKAAAAPISRLSNGSMPSRQQGRASPAPRGPS